MSIEITILAFGDHAERQIGEALQTIYNATGNIEKARDIFLELANKQLVEMKVFDDKCQAARAAKQKND